MSLLAWTVFVAVVWLVLGLVLGMAIGHAIKWGRGE